jgi:two-component system OmpR family response regulator
MELASSASDRHVVIADEEQPFGEELAACLQDYGFRVTRAADAAALEEALTAPRLDLVVLDSGFPGEPAFTICRRLAHAAGPAIILLSPASDEAERVLCLELGADDYLLKPCSPREMLARVKAVLRRYEGREAGPSQPPAGFTLRGRHLSAPNGATLLLTRGEVRMLTIFLENPDRILSREDILEKGRFPTGVSDRSIDVQISRFRKKLNDNGSQELIHTYRGAGYVLVGKVSLG